MRTPTRPRLVVTFKRDGSYIGITVKDGTETILENAFTLCESKRVGTMRKVAAEFAAESVPSKYRNARFIVVGR